MKMTNLNKIAAEALAIEAEEARLAGALSYMARPLTQATMPHSRKEGSSFMRRNGAFSMSITAHPLFGLPYGSYPRLVFAWLTTEAVRTRSPELELGQTFSGFMAELGLTPTGGRWGTIHRLQDQIKRLFTASVWCLYETDDQTTGQGFQIAEKFDLLVGTANAGTGGEVEINSYVGVANFQ